MPLSYAEDRKEWSSTKFHVVEKESFYLHFPGTRQPLRVYEQVQMWYRGKRRRMSKQIKEKYKRDLTLGTHAFQR